MQQQPTLPGMAGDVRTPNWLRTSVRALEADARIDAVVEQVAPVAAKMGSGQRGRILRGEWLGHALHPLLTDFPLGCWLASGVLDLLGGRRSARASQRLIGIGLLTVPLTSASGLADWETIDRQSVRRVGAVHAVGNTLVAGCYLRSWLHRRKGRRARGVLWGLTGGTLAWGSGYLGGHLSFGRGVGQGLRGMALANGGADGQELLGVREAAELLEVEPDRIPLMVEQGMLTATEGTGDGMRFRAEDVHAARLVGA